MERALLHLRAADPHQARRPAAGPRRDLQWRRSGTSGWTTASASRRRATWTGSAGACAGHRSAPAARRGRLPAHHDRQMGLLADEQAQREVVGAFRVEHIRLALRRLRLGHVCERERIGRERAGHQAQHQAGEILLDRDDASLACGVEGGRVRCRSARRQRERRRRRIDDQLVTVESGGGRSALLRGHLVLAQILVRELEEQLELDRHEIVTSHLASASRRGQRLQRREPGLAPHRLARTRENRGRILRLRTEWLRAQRRDREPVNADVRQSAHNTASSERSSGVNPRIRRVKRRISWGEAQKFGGRGHGRSPVAAHSTATEPTLSSARQRSECSYSRQLVTN